MNGFRVEVHLPALATGMISRTVAHSKPCDGQILPGNALSLKFAVTVWPGECYAFSWHNAYGKNRVVFRHLSSLPGRSQECVHDFGPLDLMSHFHTMRNCRERVVRDFDSIGTVAL
jgi:hypothetical protein